MTRTDIDEAIVAIARRRHLVFRPEDVFAAGGDRRLMSRRILTGAWVRPYPGVLALPGFDRAYEGLVLAAVTSLPDAVASHETSVHLFGALAGRPPVEVMVEPAGHRARPFMVHRTSFLPAEHRTLIGVIPVTTLERSVLDLAGRWGEQRLRRIAEELIVARRTTAERLLGVADTLARRGHPGADAINRLLDAVGPGYEPPASELERALDAVLKLGGFPPPRGQGPLPALRETGRVDRRYDPPHPKLIIEADGRRWHTRREDFERDRRRDNEAQACGYAIARFTYLTITREPNVVHEIVGAHFERAGWVKPNGIWLPPAPHKLSTIRPVPPNRARSDPNSGSMRAS